MIVTYAVETRLPAGPYQSVGVRAEVSAMIGPADQTGDPHEGPPPEPSVVDRIAAIKDPAVAARVNRYDRWLEIQATMRKLMLEEITKANERLKRKS